MISILHLDVLLTMICAVIPALPAGGLSCAQGADPPLRATGFAWNLVPAGIVTFFSHAVKLTPVTTPLLKDLIAQSQRRHRRGLCRGTQ